jgi:hypothetical protein
VGSPSVSAPAATADEWFPFAITDNTITAADAPNALPANVDFTYQPNWGRVTVYPMEVRFKATTGTTDKIRMRVKLDVSDCNWLQIMASDRDAGGGTLAELAVTAMLVI